MQQSSNFVLASSKVDKNFLRITATSQSQVCVAEPEPTKGKSQRYALMNVVRTFINVNVIGIMNGNLGNVGFLSMLST